MTRKEDSTQKSKNHELPGKGANMIQYCSNVLKLVKALTLFHTTARVLSL